MKFEFGKEVSLGAFTKATGMFGVMHKEQSDGTIDVLLVHGRFTDKVASQHRGVLCSVVPVNMPADVIEELEVPV